MAVDHLITPCKLSFLRRRSPSERRRGAGYASPTFRWRPDRRPSLYRDEERMKRELILWAKAVAFDAVCSSRLPRHA
ncbi:unnamed protein product [Spirodela intermedia]|uniref:Uncharacterized protein n=1 Tax=Spirodela intermedia TaxID=51605 RepID=A0A7I8J3M7_SPIIN|nr:unnamed protein product [Spirodela intermedia]CAA6664393.1 unnamed protein product [Spirodela intermedia]